MAASDPFGPKLPATALLLVKGCIWLVEQGTKLPPEPDGDGQPADGLTPCRCPEDRPSDVEPGRPVVLRTQAVYSSVLADLLSTPPEAGGALVGPRDSELITHYAANPGESTETSFTLDHITLNRQLAGWREAGLDLKGIVHSHPAGVHTPSRGDLAYLERLLGNPKNRHAASLAFPIVCDGRLWPYAAVRTGPDEVVLRTANLMLI